MYKAHKHVYTLDWIDSMQTDTFACMCPLVRSRSVPIESCYMLVMQVSKAVSMSDLPPGYLPWL